MHSPESSLNPGGATAGPACDGMIAAPVNI